ncbi:hypothetical protein DXU07_17680 [Bradyrhizobium elkanii]|nr:hypothetical protein BLN97_22190 [Bradyrhizobium elkanii]
MTIGDAAYSASSWRRPGPITPTVYHCAKRGHDPFLDKALWLWVLAFARTTRRLQTAPLRQRQGGYATGWGVCRPQAVDRAGAFVA